MAEKLSYFKSKGKKVESEKTFGQYLEEKASKHPDKTLIIYEDEKYTFARFNDDVDNFALALIDMGFKKGDIIGLSLPDWPEYSIMYYACAKLGMATTPISPRYREKEFTLMLSHSGAKGIIIPDRWGGFGCLKMINSIRSFIPDLKYIFGDIFSKVI